MDTHPVHRAGQRVYGPWGEHTSTLDWCEDNYVDFMYIAETWNSLSNVPFILLALHGMLSTLQEGVPNKARYALNHAMIAFIGIGSFIFHATLMWHAQVLLDELPMIYASFQALYCVLLEGKATDTSTSTILFHWRLPFSIRGFYRRGEAIPLTTVKLVCLGAPMVFTAAYLAWPAPVFHQVVYGALQLYLTYRIDRLYKRLPEQGPKGLKSQVNWLLKTGTALTVLAFGIWNVDNIWCEEISRWRDNMWWSVFTQGHAWWHVLVACGSNRMVTAIIALTNGLKDSDAYEVAYRLWLFPYLRRVKGVKAKQQ